MLLPVLFSVAGLFALNVLTPGASFVLTVRMSLSRGRSAGYGVALGLSFIDFLLAVLAAVGLTAVLKNNGGAILVLNCVGGAWIAAVGIKTLRQARRIDLKFEYLEALPDLASWSGICVGASAGLSNPQSIIFFASTFVVAMASEPTMTQAASVVLTIAVTSMVARCGIVHLVTLAAVRKAYLARRRGVEIVAGISLLFFGMVLVTKALVMLISVQPL